MPNNFFPEVEIATAEFIEFGIYGLPGGIERRREDLV